MEDGLPATLRQHIQAILARARGRVARLRRTSNALMTVALIGGGLATIFAGAASVGGPALFSGGVTGWQVTCGAVAFLTFIGTSAAGFNQQMRLPDRLGKAQACVGRLTALEVAFSVGGLPLPTAAERYSEIITEYQDVLG